MICCLLRTITAGGRPSIDTIGQPDGQKPDDEVFISEFLKGICISITYRIYMYALLVFLSVARKVNTPYVRVSCSDVYLT